MLSAAAAKKVTDNPGQETSRENAWPAVLRILTRRDHSLAELHQRLTAKGYSKKSIAAALQRGVELGYIDDHRYAVARATSLMRQGRAVGQRVLQDLRRRGIDQDLALQALEDARETCNEETLLADLLDKRFPGFNYHSAPARDKRRVINFLQRRGFTMSRIMDHLTRKGFTTNDEDR